jgi:hypothetical protein
MSILEQRSAAAPISQANHPKRQRTPFREVLLEAPRMGVMQTLSSALKQVFLKGIDRFSPRYMGKLKGSEYYAKVDVKPEVRIHISGNGIIN